MTRFRSSMVLLALVAGTLIVTWLQATRERPLPAGSSYSTQRDGALGMYEWATAIGGKPSRLQDVSIDPSAPPRALLIVQPESLLPESDRRAFDAIPRNGGTLVLVGDSLPLQAYARNLGVTFEPIAPSIVADPRIVSYYALHSSTASQQLLSTPAQDTVALRKPYLDGTLIVVASAAPLSNAGLEDEATARFVYREILRDGNLTFDEAHHSYIPPQNAASRVTMNDLIFGTAVGRAVVYATLLTFAYLLLAGRRLGPPIAERGATELRRTMYEHVQMLANLYRRSGQLSTARAFLVRHYQRQLARGALPPSRADALARAVSRVEQARSEPALISAVNAAEAELSP